MLTYGWDAGVLGGIIETPEFQTAMGVSFATPNIDGENLILPADAYDHHHHNDSVNVSPCIMARLRPYGHIWHAARSENLAHLR